MPSFTVKAVSIITNFFRRTRNQTKSQRKPLNPDPKDEPPCTSNKKVGVKADNQLHNRRKFLKVTALAAGGSLTSVILAGYLKPFSLISTTLDQVFDKSKETRTKQVFADASNNVVPTIMNPLNIPKFENQLSGPPPVYKPNALFTRGGLLQHEYTVEMASFNQQILPPSMNLLTKVWGYGGEAIDAITGAPLGFVQNSPGPTFEAIRGIPVKVTWQNNIKSPYMLAVDPTIHWANPNNTSMPAPPYPNYPPGYPDAQSPVPLVTHLHGGENQSFYDGGPNEWFTSNGKHGPEYNTYELASADSAVYFYPNNQQPTTLWYHDHALGVTRLNVGSGLAGFYLLRETNGNDKVQPLLPKGKFEMPLVIQDRTFNTDGSLYYPTAGSAPNMHPYWANAFLGNTIIVNGKAWPNMNVDRAQYRLRLLNGSNSRFYEISFSNGMSFFQIGSDGGYLKTPTIRTSLLIAPAERVDIIVDFFKFGPNEKIQLLNFAGSLSNSTTAQTDGQIMQFTTKNNQGPRPFDIASAPVPFNPTLTGPQFPTLPKATKQRILTMSEIPGGPDGSASETLLDGQTWDSPISETPDLGSTEDWIIVNPTMDAHPIHIHLIQFQLVQRQPINAESYLSQWMRINGQLPFNHPTINVSSLSGYVNGLTITPQSWEQGWKDTIVVNSAEAVTLRVRFAPQDGSAFTFDATLGPGYVWHCHLLEHEDNEMMRPYKIKGTNQKNVKPELLTIAIVVAVSATVILLAYYYQRTRQKT